VALTNNTYRFIRKSGACNEDESSSKEKMAGWQHLSAVPHTQGKASRGKKLLYAFTKIDLQHLDQASSLP
jgi:hypothetical protein